MKFTMKTMIDYIKKSIHRMTILVLLFVTLCVVIPVLYFMRSVYSDSVKRFETTLIKTIQAETDSYAKLLEQEFQMIHRQMYILSTDNALASLRVKFQMEKYDEYFSSQLQQVQSNLRTINNCHSIVSDTEIYYPGELRKISVSSVNKYEEHEERLEQIVMESNYGHFWNDTNKVVIWNSGGYRSQSHNLRIITASQITKSSMRGYFDKYKKNKDVFWAVCVKTGEKDEFYVSTDELFRRECIPNELRPGEYRVLSLEGEEYLLTCSQFQEGMLFYQLFSFDEVTVILDEYKWSINILVVVLICFLILFVFVFYRMIHKPIEHAKRTFARMENNEIGVLMGKTWCIEFQEMYDQFDSMSKRIQQLIEQEYQLQLLNTEAQVKQLQYQINPHFLYNTYFTLCGLIQEMDYDNAEKVAELMGKYLKYITVSGNAAVSLEDELEHAYAYGEIQKLRFLNRLSICFEECPDCLKLREVPRLIVQPLIENAFAHGIKDRMDGGIIRVNVSQYGSCIKICVEDNGVGMTEEKLCALQEQLHGNGDVSGESVALLNIHKRLVMLYGPGSGLYVSKSRLGGLLCELVICRKEGDTDEKDSGG